MDKHDNDYYENLVGSLGLFKDKKPEEKAPPKRVPPKKVPPKANQKKSEIQPVKERMEEKKALIEEVKPEIRETTEINKVVEEPTEQKTPDVPKPAVALEPIVYKPVDSKAKKSKANLVLSILTICFVSLFFVISLFTPFIQIGSSSFRMIGDNSIFQAIFDAFPQLFNDSSSVGGGIFGMLCLTLMVVMIVGYIILMIIAIIRQIVITAKHARDYRFLGFGLLTFACAVGVSLIAFLSTNLSVFNHKQTFTDVSYDIAGILIIINFIICTIVFYINRLIRKTRVRGSTVFSCLIKASFSIIFAFLTLFCFKELYSVYDYGDKVAYCGQFYTSYNLTLYQSKYVYVPFAQFIAYYLVEICLIVLPTMDVCAYRERKREIRNGDIKERNDRIIIPNICVVANLVFGYVITIVSPDASQFAVTQSFITILLFLIGILIVNIVMKVKDF